jgi:hypothetical protein
VKVNFRAWTSDMKGFQNFTLDSEPELEDRLVVSFAKSISQQFPGTAFEIIKVGKKRYNVIPHSTASA